MIDTYQSTPNALGFESDYVRSNSTESPLGGMTSLGVHMIDKRRGWGSATAVLMVIYFGFIAIIELVTPS